MNTISYIKEKGWDSLKSDLSIKTKIYEEYGIVKLNYDQINSPKTHPVVMECRALILSYPDANIVSRAFPRFFNYGEALDITKKCNLTSAEFYEKVDGSLIQVYFCIPTRKWEIATRGMAFAEGSDNSGDITGSFRSFRTAVLNAMGNWDENKFQSFSYTLNEQLTYIFEYCGPSNQIVTPYETNHLVLLSIVENSTGKEFINRIAACVDLFKINWNMNVRCPKIFNFESEKHMLDALDKFENREEGFVALDKTTGVRVKIKSPKYVRLHHLRGDILTQQKILELIVSGEADEYLTYFSEDKHKFVDYQNRWDNFKKELKDTQILLSGIVSQKEYASFAKKYSYSRLLFSSRKKNTDIIDELNNEDIEYKYNLFIKIHSDCNLNSC